jgi:hypothetical protein
MMINVFFALVDFWTSFLDILLLLLGLISLFDRVSYLNIEYDYDGGEKN